jgi:hypothetical protein
VHTIKPTGARVGAADLKQRPQSRPYALGLDEYWDATSSSLGRDDERRVGVPAVEVHKGGVVEH